MSFFVNPTKAPAPKTTNVQKISFLLGGIFLVMALSQLFTFEKFPSVIEQMWVGGESQAKLIAAILVTTEVLALPFLLRLRLSIAMRFLSMVMGWLAIVLWLWLALWQNIQAAPIANSGLLGATLKLPVGLWDIFFFIGLAVLAAWTAWGMWPLQKSTK